MMEFDKALSNVREALAEKEFNEVQRKQRRFLQLSGDWPPLAPNTLQSLGVSRLTHQERLHIQNIAIRAHDIATKHALGGVPDKMAKELNPQILATDVAVCHLHRNLRLSEFLTCNDLTFIAEFTLLQKFINRPLMFFPKSPRLRFALIGATVTH